MNIANSTEPEAVHKAILAIKGYKGLEGTYEYDARRDSLHGYNVVKNEGSFGCATRSMILISPKRN